MGGWGVYGSTKEMNLEYYLAKNKKRQIKGNSLKMCKFRLVSHKIKRRKERKHLNRFPKTYSIYIKSKWWEERKNRYFQNNPRKCAVCGSCNFVQLHHAVYANYGKEKDEHLFALCSFHHKKFHEHFGKPTRNMVKATNNFIIMCQFVGELGLEPRFDGSKPPVLPLDDSPDQKHYSIIC